MRGIKEAKACKHGQREALVTPVLWLTLSCMRCAHAFALLEYASQQPQQATLHPILCSYKEGEYGGFLVLSARHWCLWLCPASGCCVSDDPEYRCLTIDSAVRHHIHHQIIKCEHALAGANAGLKVARDLLEPIKEKFPWISYADLWTLAGVTAVEEMGGACPRTRPLSCQQMHGCCGEPAAVFYVADGSNTRSLRGMEHCMHADCTARCAAMRAVSACTVHVGLTRLRGSKP